MLSLKQGITIGFVVIVLALYFTFPTHNSAESFTALIFFLIILPLLYIKIVLRQSLTLPTTDAAPTVQWHDLLRSVGGFLALILFLLLLSKSGVLAGLFDQPSIQSLSLWHIALFSILVLFPVMLLFSFFVYKLLAHLIHFLPQRLRHVVLFGIFVLLTLPLQILLPTSLPLWILFLPFLPLLALRTSFMIRRWYIVPLFLIGAISIVYKFIIISL